VEGDAGGVLAICSEPLWGRDGRVLKDLLGVQSKEKGTRQELTSRRDLCLAFCHLVWELVRPKRCMCRGRGQA
jgi:hypothetical protein